MKAKTIKAVIRKKIDEWIASIDDEAVRGLAEANTIVTGGCIASMLLKEKVNDFDLYFRNRETALAISNYYVARFSPAAKNGIACKISVDESKDDRIRIVVKSAGIASEDGTTKAYEYFESRPDGDAAAYVGDVMVKGAGNVQETYEELEEAAQNTDDEDSGKPKYRPVFMSTNAITLSNRIQLVLRFYGAPDEIHKNYDFVHCTNYWTSNDSELVLRQPALESLLAKELRYVGSKYPVCSLIRLRKFIQRGWSVNAGQILKMVMQANELDLKDIEVLQDQLTGVDCAYFCQVIERLKERDSVKLEAAYLIEIIDRMF